ncbi:MAG: hypothetical protein M3N53_08645 [Actinomycetota bacterium]|nr:hypothetical protein [Actinomycetota bacterium]
MNNLILAHGGQSFGDYGGQWLYFLAPFVVAAVVISYLAVAGGTGSFLDRVSTSLERITGLPAWSAGGIGMGLFALVVAVLGFYWDVAWHIELGRDQFIFTPAHMGILVGLALIVVAGATSIVLATSQRAETRLTFRAIRIPLSVVPLTLLGIGALCGFPLDEFWHRNYGIDVTMWGPTHLVMISGASLTPIALLLLHTEGRSGRRLTKLGLFLAEVLAGALVVGLSTWTGEFDFGVPQFQALYHPVLVMAGSAVALVAARHLLGPGGAVRAAVGAVILRALVALVVGAGLGLVIPRFPLFVGTAAAVEAGFWVTRHLSGIRAALTTGALIATAGFASEWAWMSLWGRHAWTSDLFPGALVAVVAAVAATLIGWAMGHVLRGAPANVGKHFVAPAAMVLLLSLAAPLPRNDAQVGAVLETERVTRERAFVEITLEQPAVARGANWFEVLSWQGGAVEVTELNEVAPGRFRSARAVPVTGDWKTVVRLANDDVMLATGVYLPADPEIGAAEVPVEPRRAVELQEDGDFLLREAREGAAWPALIAYTAILLLGMIWLTSLTIAFLRVQASPARGRARPRSALRRQVPA